MNRDKEIYGVASIYIRDHGDDAVIEAAMRADALLDAGDLDGQRVWLRVIEAIKPVLSPCLLIMIPRHPRRIRRRQRPRP